MQNTITLDPQQPVADLVLEHSECAQVFQKHRIDFCCRGEMSIEAAAKGKGVDVDALLAELARAIALRNGGPATDVREVPTAELVAYIVATHHNYLREALPFVRGLALKVSRVHGEHNPKLRDLQVAVEELGGMLIEHLDDEETSLFPALTAAQTDTAKAHTLLADMHDEHLAVAKVLERIEAAADGFTLPDWACNSYRTLFAELRRLESDVFTHVHLENHVLKPRFTA